MIASDLTSQQTEELHHVLLSYLNIFHICGHPLGQATGVTHRINTGDELPIHRRPCRVSTPERQIIESDVDKMLS